MFSSFYSLILGGFIIGLSTSALLLFNGRAASVSGIFNGLLQVHRGDIVWRFCFIVGIIGFGYIAGEFADFEFVNRSTRSLEATVLAGLLVGFGTALGTGCISGHAISGIGRGSRRSLVATLIFLIVASITASTFNLF